MPHHTPSARSAPGSPLLGIAVAGVGLAVLVGLWLSIAADPGVRSAFDASLGAERPSPVVALLDGFGILVPALALLLAGGALGAGLGIARGATNAIRTSASAATWLSILVGALALLRWTTGVPAWTDAGGASGWIGGALGPTLVLVALVALRQGLARAGRAPGIREEPLASREARTAWNLLVPALLILLFVAARPLEATVITSFTDKRFASDAVPNYVGLDNYRRLLTIDFQEVGCRTEADGSCARTAAGAVRWEALPRERLVEGYRTAWHLDLPFLTAPDRAIAVNALDRTWVRSLWVTLVFAVASVSLELLLGLFIALTVHSEFRGRGAMRAVMLVPWAIPTVVSARLWELMLKDSSAGLVNRVLMTVGAIDAPQAWLTTSALQLPSAIMIDVWKTAPFMALLLLAGLQVIPKELYESARVDGASRFREFVSITLPLLRPAIAVALIFRTLDALRVFDLFNVLFGRSEQSVSTYNFEMLINNQEAGYASAIGVLIFFLIFGIAVLYVRFLGVNRT